MSDLIASVQLLLTSVARMGKRLDDLTTWQTQVNSIAKYVDTLKVTIINLDQEAHCRRLRITGGCQAAQTREGNSLI